jgi:EPS-associated MarR family transcriptional regulator
LREIADNPRVTQRQLAEKYGISLGKTNFLIKAFLERGLIKVKRFKNSKQKTGYLYALTPDGIKKRVMLTRHFLQIKQREYEVLKEEIAKLGGV